MSLVVRIQTLVSVVTDLLAQISLSHRHNTIFPIGNTEIQALSKGLMSREEGRMMKNRWSVAMAIGDHRKGTCPAS